MPLAFRSRRVRWVLIAASVLGVLIGLDTLLLHLRLDPLADVRAYYDAGARLNAGEPLYLQSATTDEAGFYRYPPLLAIAFRPLALLPFQTAALIWEGVLIALFLATLIRLGLRNQWTWIVTGWLAAPIAWSLAVGQAQVAVTFLAAVGSPWAIALAGHLKILPVVMAIYWLGTTRSEFDLAVRRVARRARRGVARPRARGGRSRSSAFPISRRSDPSKTDPFTRCRHCCGPRRSSSFWASQFAWRRREPVGRSQSRRQSS